MIFLWAASMESQSPSLSGGTGALSSWSWVHVSTNRSTCSTASRMRRTATSKSRRIFFKNCKVHAKSACSHYNNNLITSFKKSIITILYSTYIMIFIFILLLLLYIILQSRHCKAGRKRRHPIRTITPTPRNHPTHERRKTLNSGRQNGREQIRPSKK